MSKGDENKTRKELLAELKVLRERLRGVPPQPQTGAGAGAEAVSPPAPGSDEALGDIELKFRLFLEHVPVYVFFKDEQIRSLHLSRNYEQMLGRPLDALLGKTMDELFPSELARSMVEDDRRILREGKPLEVEEEFAGRFYSTLKFPIYIDGKPCFLAGFTTDITQRKIAETRLKESEERFKSAFDHAAIGMALVGKDGRFLKVNSSLCRLVGYSEEELLTLTFQEITYPADLDADLALAAKLFAGEIPSYQMEKRYIHKNGAVIWSLLSGSVVRAENGSVLYGLAQIQDFTERKQMEAERAQLIAELREALEKIKTLRGIIPICASCKKIRDDEGYWQQIEEYIRNRSEAEFSHGMCPECIKKLYPDLNLDDLK